MYEKLGSIWLQYFEPKGEFMCKETRHNLKTCVAESLCFEKTNDFKKCMQEDIDPACISLRKQYSKCKRSAIDRSRDFRIDNRNK